MTVYALKSRKASGPVAMGLVEPGGIYDPFETKSTQGGRKEPRAKKSKKKKKGS
jgi:hypothetical protein